MLDLATCAYPRDLRLAPDRAACAVEVAQALMPGRTPTAAWVHRDPGAWALWVLVDGVSERRPLPATTEADASRLPDGTRRAHALALAQAWEALCAPKRGAA
jgi:hypothetical protein